MSKKQISQKALRTTYMRYIFPIISDILLIIAAFIPCIQYTLNTDTRESLSLFGLLGNAWGNSRRYLFSAETQHTNDGDLFYKVVFITMILLIVLWLIGVAVNIFSISALVAMHKDKNDPDAKKTTDLYITLIPNRIVLSILRALVIPIFFFPHLLVLFYHRILLYAVSLNVLSIIPAALSVILFIANICLMLIAKKHEIRADINIFTDKRKSRYHFDTDEEENSGEEECKTKLYHITQTSKEDRDTNIRNLLNDDK